MNNDIKLNTVSWILMITLILASFYLAESNINHLFFVVITLTIIKFFMVTFQFIEVKHAHIIWKLLSILFVLSYIIGCLIIS